MLLRGYFLRTELELFREQGTRVSWPVAHTASNGCTVPAAYKLRQGMEFFLAMEKCSKYGQQSSRMNFVQTSAEIPTAYWSLLCRCK